MVRVRKAAKAAVSKYSFFLIIEVQKNKIKTYYFLNINHLIFALISLLSSQVGTLVVVSNQIVD